MKTFEQELAAVINKCSKENESNTPDFVLAKYMNACLEAYTEAIQSRAQFAAKCLEEQMKRLPLDNERKL